MDGSPSSVLTLGLGDWGSPSLLITLGLGVGEEERPFVVCGTLTLDDVCASVSLDGLCGSLSALECCEVQ